MTTIRMLLLSLAFLRAGLQQLAYPLGQPFASLAFLIEPLL
jgi:hypothetical protein